LVEDSYHKDRIANRRLHPETLMMGYGYAPGLSEGSLKPPIFLTSTFVFENAQQGKDFFDLTSGRRQPRPGEKSGLVYSRFKMFSNIEPILDRWISDNGLRATLRNDPARAARDVGVNLTSEEEEALRAIDWSQSDGELTARVSKCVGQ
jgi:hypothetical protein